MTPEEIEQLVNEKVTIAMAVYEAIRSNKASSKAVEGQEAMARNAKRKQDGNQGKDSMQYANKKQKIVKTCDAGKNVRKGYVGNHPYCKRCGRHHPGRCTVVCNKCKKVGHMAKDCRVVAPMAKAIIPGACYKCGSMGHLKRNCPNQREQTLKKTQGKAYMMVPKEEPM